MQIINLQITPNGVMPKVYASQFDVGREIQFNLYDGATAFVPPAGTAIRFEGKKSDGNGFSYACTYNDNVVTVALTDQMTVFAEEVPCELRLDYNGTDIGTINVILAIEKSPIDENTPMSDTEIPAIIELARNEQYNAEAWAEGTRNGVPVGPTDPTYENNAKYYAEHSTASIASLSDTNIQDLTDGQILKYDADSGDWINANESGGSSTLGGLTDVTITTPTNGQILKYDAANDEWVNGDAPSGAGGSTVTITTAESALFGQAVTITDGVDTYTGTFDNTGNCEIQGVAITGTATVSATGGGQTATASLTMPYFGNYSTTLAFFSATVNVTFPYANGASCILSDGVTTLTANTSPMAFNVPNTGTWTATVTLDGQTKTDSAIITSDGQTASLTIEYGTINLSYDNDFKGETITCTSGGTTITKTAPNDANAMTFYPPTTGNWSISGTAGGVTYTASPDPIVVSSLSTAVSAILQTIPDGSTVTPTDDIQTWLACGGIFNKNYTTIGQVLADSTTLLALISDNNAVDYMVRSTTWASSVCANSTAMTDIGANDYCASTLLANSTWSTAIANSTYFESVLNVKVPTMTSNTTPSGECLVWDRYGTDFDPWHAFDNNESTRAIGYNVSNGAAIGYNFNRQVKVVKVHIKAVVGNPGWEPGITYLQGSNDGNTWVDLGNINITEYIFDRSFTVYNETSYSKYRIQSRPGNTSHTLDICELQFYGR